MIIGFTIFVLGALGRWHRNRQLGAIEQNGRLVDTPSDSWRADCILYACRPLAARGAECEALCDRAISEGTPTVQAERITLACQKHCASESTPTAACASECLVREAARSVVGRSP